MTVRIDFHTHSQASDGALTAQELLQRAKEAGLDLFAITDHDTVAGYRQVADWQGSTRLIAGVELSCQWSGATIHVVGLGVDCDHPALQQGLAQLADARQQRARRIAERLEAKGFQGALAGAQAQAGQSQIGRPHFAAWMVEQGLIKDAAQAFDRYLGRGKTGDVKAFWPQLAQVTGWIVAAGGVAVLAHPLKYRFTRMKLQRLATDFRAAGGEAIELISGRDNGEQRAQLLRLARELELEVSIGSDFHRDSPYGAPIGLDLPELEQLRGVWQRWL